MGDFSRLAVIADLGGQTLRQVCDRRADSAGHVFASCAVRRAESGGEGEHSEEWPQEDRGCSA